MWFNQMAHLTKRKQIVKDKKKIKAPIVNNNLKAAALLRIMRKVRLNYNNSGSRKKSKKYSRVKSRKRAA